MGLLRDHKENSQLYWWPLVKDLDVPKPKTIIVNSREALEDAAAELGYPLFLRTDYTSLKHSWKKSSLVENADQLWTHSNFMKIDSAFQALPVNAYILRELLPLETSFTAFSGEMPVHKERRYFLRDGKVQCQHPYWPEEAFYGQMIEGWKDKLAKLNACDCGDFHQLALNAFKVAEAVKGYWSVDFAKSTNGVWYLLDMAKGEDSYHWKDCNENPE